MKSQKLWWWWVERAKAQEQLKLSFSAEDMTVSTACGLLLGLKGQGHEAAVLVQRSDPRSWPSHWFLVSSGRTLQLEGSTSKPWLCTRAKSVAAEKGPFDVGGAKSAAWESRWADFSLWALTCLVLKWPSIYWEMCLNFLHRNHLGMLPWDSVKPGQQSGDFLCQCSETGEIWNWWNVNKPKGKEILFPKSSTTFWSRSQAIQAFIPLYPYSANSQAAALMATTWWGSVSCVAAFALSVILWLHRADIQGRLTHTSWEPYLPHHRICLFPV